MNLCLFLYLASIETDRQFILLSYLRELCVPLVSRSLSLPLSSLRQQLVKINHTATGTTYKVGQNAPRGNVWWLGKERETEWIMPWFMCQISAMLSASSPIPDDLHWLFSCHTLSLSFLLFLYFSLDNSPPRITKQPPTDELLFKVAQQNKESDKPFIIECEADGQPEPE